MKKTASIILLLAALRVTAQPTISSVSPMSGNPGSTVTITGTGFNTTPASDVVYFGATRATVSTATSTSLSVTVPSGATFAPVTVNSGAGLAAASQYPFLPTYNNGTYLPNTINYDTLVTVPTAVNPSFVSIGDMDGDGKPDMIVSYYYNGIVNVYRNISSGGTVTSSSFAAPVPFSITTHGSDFFSGQTKIVDIDLDGKLDIVADDGYGAVVLRNTSTSGLLSFDPVVTLTELGSSVLLTVGDIDGDGKPDIAFTYGHNVSILRNNSVPGAVSFTTAVDLVSDSAIYSVIMSDIDGDGKLDLCAAYSHNLLSVFLNTSSPSLISFAPRTNITVPYSYVGGMMAVGDLDGDGKQDLVVSDYVGGLISILHNTSSPGVASFDPPISLFDGFDANPTDISISYMDGDGKPDLAVLGEIGIRLYHNNCTTGAITAGSFVLANRFVFSGDWAPGSMAMGDLNADGKPEIVAVQVAGSISTNTIAILTSDPLPRPPVVTALSSSVDLPGATITITGANFNATPANNVVYFGATRAAVTAGSSTSLSVNVPAGATTAPISVLNTANARMGASQQAFLPTYNNAGYIPDTVHFDPAANFVHGDTLSAIGDIDGDGKADIVTIGGTAVRIYRNTSTSGSITTSSFAAPMSLSTLAGSAALALGDMDGDGKLDVVIVNNVTDSIYVFLNTSSSGAPSFATPLSFLNFDPKTTKIIIGDADGDGRPEMITLGYLSRELVVYYNVMYHGQLSFKYTDPMMAPEPSLWSDVALADIDGDGKPELVIGSRDPFEVLIFPNTMNHEYGFSSGFNSAPVAVPVSDAVRIAVDDIDGDGKQDIVAMSQVDPVVSVLRNTSIPGIISMAPEVTFTDSFTTDMAIADIDGDGKPDIVTATWRDPSFAVLRNTAVSGTISASSFHCIVVNDTDALYPGPGLSVGDLDGDGKADLVSCDGTKMVVRRNSPLTPSSLAPISGAMSVCVSGTTSLSDATPGGTWSSSNTAVGTIGSSTGIVAGISAGTTTISYTTGSGTVTATVTVNPLPDAGTITGITSFCAGSSTTLSDGVTGGVWSATGVVTVVPTGATVLVAGNSPGSASISYTVTNSCGSAVATTTVTVNSTVVSAGTITGNPLICVSGSATTALTDAVPGGLWTSSGGVTVDGSGNVTGVALGTATVSYTVGGSCGSATATYIVTVTAGSAGTITGGTSICSTGTTALTDAVTGGTWSSGNPGVATVSASGLVSGVSLGTATISYTTTGSCGGTATLVVTVSAGVSAGTITGTATTCTGSTTTLSDVVSGGAWSSGNTLVATAASTGIITGVATGTATIYYTVSNSCGTATATKIVTVNSAPGAGSITGTAVLCAGATTSLADPTGAPGGVWSSAVASVATVGTSGIVTGVATGTTTISYTVTNSCGTSTATRVVTVNAATTAGTITGTTTLCTGTTTALTDAVTGGVWSSGTPAVATVGTGGIVTGVSAGTATISYTISNSCGTVRATTVVTVTGSSAGTIAGPATVITGTTISLTASLGGGTWSASNTNASVSGTGVVTGVTVGTVIISYTLSGGCGAVSATKLITVSNATVPPISGYYFYLCAGATSLFWDATTGGTWGISPTSVATVSPTGVVAGISAGVATLSYTYGGTTVTAAVTINAAPAAITGAPTMCSGTTTLLSDATPGGTWSSSAASVATISTAGLVTGSTTGTTTIYYTGTGGCKASMVLTVTSAPSGIGGATSVCAGASITMSDFTLGGTWSSTGTATVVATGPTTALVSGITPGAATITYSLGASCYRTFNLSVKAVPTPILGSLSVCGLGAVTFLSDVTSGVSWTIAPTTVATVSPSGRVYGVSAGTANVTFTATNGCITTAMVTVNAAVAVSPITGPTNVSHLATITLSDVTPGGIWISSNPALGSVNGVGDVTGVGTSGTVTISYAVAYAGGNCNTIVTKPITVHTPAPPTHSSTTTVGATMSIADELAAGDWMSSDNTIATVDESGTITALAEGSAQITHISASSEGAIVTATTQLFVNALPFEVRMVPNPNNGTFTIGGTIGSKMDEQISIEITDMLGQVVYRNSAMATGGLIEEQILLNGNFANGMYLLNVKSKSESKVLHFVIEK